MSDFLEQRGNDIYINGIAKLEATNSDDAWGLCEDVNRTFRSYEQSDKKLQAEIERLQKQNATALDVVYKQSLRITELEQERDSYKQAYEAAMLDGSDPATAPASEDAIQTPTLYRVEEAEALRVELGLRDDVLSDDTVPIGDEYLDAIAAEEAGLWYVSKSETGYSVMSREPLHGSFLATFLDQGAAVRYALDLKHAEPFTRTPAYNDSEEE